METRYICSYHDVVVAEIFIRSQNAIMLHTAHDLHSFFGKKSGCYRAHPNLCLFQMVTTFGMSEIGPWSLMEPSAQSMDVIMRMMARNSMSEKLAEDIDAAVKRISDCAYEIALSHIRNNREAIDKIVEVLLEKETMAGDEFRAILSEFVEIPPENRVPSSTPAAVPV